MVAPRASAWAPRGAGLPRCVWSTSRRPFETWPTELRRDRLATPTSSISSGGAICNVLRDDSPVARLSQVGERQFGRVLDMVTKIRALGMEVCTTLGMLTPEQAVLLRSAGLTAYNHNLDTSPEYYGKITTTRRCARNLTVPVPTWMLRWCMVAGLR